MKNELNITRTFDFPRQLVFQAWTDPRHLDKWWGPHGFTNPVCKADVRPGGAIHIDMRSPDGVTYPMFGTFREVTPPQRLSFVCGPVDADGKYLFEVLNTVEFTEKDGKTTMALKATVQNSRPGFEQHWKGAAVGWSQSLEKLEDALGPLRTITTLRALQAPRELVWEAFTNPQHVVNWWGPRGFTSTIEKMDVRPGGVWKQVMKGPDGTLYHNEYVFKEVVKPEKIVMSHGGHREGGPSVRSEATWTFHEIEPNITLVEIRMRFPTAEEREFVAKEFKAVEGAQQTLERFDEYLAAMPAPKT